MSDQSLNGLLQWMQGKSVTFGWSAIVTMNRGKVNQLLEQQYISRFNQNSFLPRIHGNVELNDSGHVLELTGLLLSQPRLSFETASLQNSRARLTMDIVSGMVAHKSETSGSPPRISSSFAIAEQHGFQLVMDVDLAAVMGSVDRMGEVVLDLADAYNFTCNLVEQSIAQQALGEFFHKLFKRQPPSFRRYVLGMLDFDPDDKLAPRSFKVLTQAAPGGRDVRSGSYGEGGVVLFVRTREAQYEGEIPSDESQFRYLIPDDRDAESGKPLYSGSLILSSRAVFDWYLHSYLQTLIGHGLALEHVSAANDLALELRARAGEWLLDNVDTWFTDGVDHFTIKNNDLLTLPFASNAAGSVPLEVTTMAGGLLRFRWKGGNTFSFYFTKKHGHDERAEHADLRLVHELEFHLKASVDPETSVVVFERVAGGSSQVSVQKINGDIDLAPHFARHVESLLKRVVDAMNEQLQQIRLPGLDLFAINHLLFPEQNALLLTRAALPGDLALFGQVNPKHTALKLEPSIVHVLAGTTQQFAVLESHLNGKAGAITWSVRSIDGSRSGEEIDQKGLFAAPPRERMLGKAVRYVVTATREESDGQIFTTSALVVVVAEALVVTPSMVTVETGTVEPVTLKAAALGGGSIKWSLRKGPGSLQANGNQVVYTPPQSIEPRMDSALVEAEDTSTGAKATATVILSRGLFFLNLNPPFHPGLAPGATTLVRWVKEAGDSDEAEWSVIAGDGTVDPITGEFTAPNTISMPYSVVMATVGEGSRADRGYSIIHQSEYATEAKWSKLQVFELKALSPLQLFSNGQQQVAVQIEVAPADVDGIPQNISDTELNSIVLVDAYTLEPLARVDEEGVPDGGGWAYNEKRNDYRFHPGNRAPADDSASPQLRTKTLYVQTRSDSVTTLAAMLTRDDLMPFYSNEHGNGEPGTLEPIPADPPKFGPDSYDFKVTRVDGEADNDYHLETVDYYVLQLIHGGEQIPFIHVEFEERSGMVQWESRQFEEDAVSFTGYALYGDTQLRFDKGLYDHIPEVIRPVPEIVAGEGCPEGGVLISLHRTQYWRFDLACEQSYARTMKLRVVDEFGNAHSLQVKFKAPIDRNELVVI